ncbi:MAG: hypothetical protein CMI23_07945 [Opitutae bacterium]|nr:hypothetical protein [Opitutae bacterium]|tara:strand:+ start:548 stop:856 length:309 start_codon:yes stop_codon:yes gene_type:complete
MINIPTNIEIIGNSLAIKWGDGEDIFLEANHLRKHSPSAENKGESDIFGNISGGQKKIEYEQISLIKFFRIGNYAIRIHFSDGHSTGIFSWEYLKKLSEEQD